MEFMGVKDRADMWINYIPGEVAGLDDRVLEFFQNVYILGMVEYEGMRSDSISKNEKEERRREYLKLKEEFEPTHQSKEV